MINKVLSITLFISYALAAEDVPTSFAVFNDYHNMIKHIQSHYNDIHKPASSHFSSQPKPASQSYNLPTQSPPLTKTLKPTIHIAETRPLGLSAYASSQAAPSQAAPSPISGYAKPLTAPQPIHYTAPASHSVQYPASFGIQHAQYSSGLDSDKIQHSAPSSHGLQYSVPQSQEIQYPTSLNNQELHSSAPSSHGIQYSVPQGQEIQYPTSLNTQELHSSAPSSHGLQYSVSQSQEIQYPTSLKKQELHSSAPAVHFGQYTPVGQSGHHQEEYAPAKYEFAYGVEDHHTGDIHSHKESRDGDFTQGEYSLHDADGTVRTVKYNVKKDSGFNAVVERTGQAHAKPELSIGKHY